MSKIPCLDVDPDKVQTNIVVVGIARTGLDSSAMVQLLKKRGVLAGTVDESTLRLLTHLDVTRGQMVQTAAIFGAALRG